MKSHSSMLQELEVNDFLLCATPAAWLAKASRELNLLLVDHAHCEKKAASTAINLMFRYVEDTVLQQKLSRLAREELKHFESVLAIINRRGLSYHHLPPARYAEVLRKQVRSAEPQRLVDTLIVNALIEARSCERFSCLIPYLDEELAHFYRQLHRAEARHFHDYLRLAMRYDPLGATTRIQHIAEIERQLILAHDEQFRFHSGVPQ